MRHLDGVYSINATQNGLLILQEVLLVSIQRLEKSFNLITSHGFEDESFVVAKEEEASTLARVLTCLEDHFPVLLTFEREFNVLGSDSISFSDLLKNG